MANEQEEGLSDHYCLNDTRYVIAAVSCSLSVHRLGRVGLGLGLTGKLGHAWVSAWHGAVGWWMCAWW